MIFLLFDWARALGFIRPMRPIRKDVNHLLPKGSTPIILWCSLRQAPCDPFVRLFVCANMFFFPPSNQKPPPALSTERVNGGSFFFILLKTLFIYQTFSHIFQQARGTRPSARHQSLMMRTGANDDVECSIITRAITRASTANNTN